MVIYACVKSCSVMLEHARSVILYEMINDLLCINPVKAEQKQCLLVETITRG